MGILVSSKAAEGIKYTIDELEIRAIEAIRGSSNTEIKTSFSHLATVAKQFAEDRVNASADTTTLNSAKLRLDRSIAAKKFLMSDSLAEVLATYSLLIYSCAMEGYAISSQNPEIMKTYEAIGDNNASQQERISSLIEGKENAMEKRRSLCL